MFVVKRPFRNFGKVYTAGTVITDPADIKRFRGRLAEGKIIEVTEQTLESTTKYFKEKYGVDLVPDKKSGTTQKAEVKQKVEVKQEAETEAPKKAVAKAK